MRSFNRYRSQALSGFSAPLQLGLVEPPFRSVGDDKPAQTGKGRILKPLSDRRAAGGVLLIQRFSPTLGLQGDRIARYEEVILDGAGLPARPRVLHRVLRVVLAAIETEEVVEDRLDHLFAGVRLAREPLSCNVLERAMERFRLKESQLAWPKRSAIACTCCGWKRGVNVGSAMVPRFYRPNGLV